MRFILGASDLTNITTNKIFGGLSIVQIVIFFVSVLLAILVGLFIGACVFYQVGAKSILKQIQKKRAEKMATRENEQVENIVAEKEVHKVMPTTLEYSDEDYSLDDDILDDEILDDEILDDDSQDEDIKSVIYGDKDYMALVSKRQKEVPVITRNYLINKVYSMNVISDKINIEVFAQTQTSPFVRVTAGGCTYLYVFTLRKVMKLFVRLHEATYNSLKDRAGDMIAPAPDFGLDWYSLTVGDFENARAIATNLVELAYRYTAQTEFESVDGEIKYKGESYEEHVQKVAMEYNPVQDEKFVAVIDELQKKYNLKYFGKSEACSFTSTKLLGSEKATAINLVGNRPAILKAGEIMFGIMFETYGVGKLIFRADEKYIDALKTKHEYVKESTFPVSENWKWFSILLDESYSVKEIRQIIQDSYNYVIAFNSSSSVDELDVDINVGD